MDIGIITVIFLFITFIGFVAGISMFTSKEGMGKNIAFVITCCINTFFSVLNLLTIPEDNYSKLIFSIVIILFALLGIILRFTQLKASKFSPLLVFVTMIISMVSIFS